MSLPKALQDSLRAGNVIPFVGAGVSMSVLNNETRHRLFPSWRELLERAARRLEEEDRTPYADIVRGLLALDKPDYLDAARRAREGLGESIWYRFLKEQLDYPRERAKPESLRLAEAIWKLNNQLIITTNYDDVLRWASSSNPVLWDREAPAEMAAFLRNETKRPAIWHLHGHIHNTSKIILTRDGYGLLYPEAREGESQAYYEAALQTLRSLLTSHTFLFIGFSLDDAYFGMQLEGIKNIYQGANGPHYVLMRRKELERGIPFGDTVRAIAFDDFGEPLLELVNELAAIVSGKESDASAVTEEPAAAVASPRVADYNPRNYVFSVPFREKGDQVIGRKASLQAVREQLTKGRRTAIGQTAAFQGLGGLGKTQLAVEYAFRFKDTYPNGVIWLNADQDIDAQLTELAEKARWIAPASEHKYKLEIARHRLRTYSDCLIIFDNLEDPQAIENYLPEPQADPHILVTSRRDQPDFNPVPLDPLNEALSLELLLQEAGRKPVGDEEEIAAHEIAGALDGLPLALELAGAYLRHRTISWQQYRDLLRHSPKAALPGKLRTFTKHETDLYSTLRINEEIFKEDPKLKEILDLLTWSGTAPMGVSLICTLLRVNNPLELTNAFVLGATLRLLQKTPDVDSYSIHRLIGEVRREEIPLQERQDWVDDICQRLGDWFEERRENFSDLFHFEAEIDHLQAWQENARQYAPKHSSRLIWLQAYPSYHRGNYQEIKRLVGQALELLEKEHKTDLKLKAHLFNDLGFCYGSLGDYKRDLEYVEKALEIRRDLFGEHHPDTATSFNNVGSAYANLGDYKRDLEYSEKALEIYRELFGERHRHTAASFNNVGTACGRLGDYKRSLEYVEKALEIYRELFGERHPDTARAFNNVGSTCGHLGDYKRGLEYLEKALEINRELFGERHPDTSNSLNNIGDAYGHLGDYKRGLEYAEKALEIHGELFGERHPNTAASFNNVGTAYGHLGDYKRNLEYVEKAIKLYRETLGDKHPHTILTAGNLISLLANLNRQPEAFELLEECLNQLPKDHIHYNSLKKLEQGLLSQTIRPGFRQPSGKSQGGKRRGKKNKRRQ